MRYSDIEGFKKHLTSRGLTVNTAKTYSEAVIDYYKRYRTINRLSILEWKDGMAGRYKPQTIACRIKGMNAYLDYKGIDMHLSGIKLERISHLDNVISVSDYHKLIRGLYSKGDIVSLRWRLLYMTIAMTGMRVSEVRQLTVDHVLAGRSQIYTKGGIYRTVLLPKRLVYELKTYLSGINQEDGYIFGSRPEKPYAIGSIETRMKMHADEFRIPRDVMHPHSLRHLFGKNFMKNKGDITVLADILGHASIETTRIYTRRTLDEQMELLDKLVTW